MMDRPTFRSVFLEFGNAAVYPDALVDFWFGRGTIRLDPERWADLLDEGLGLFVAHNLTLARRNAVSAASGAAPGENTGPKSAKSIDKVSASYDTGAVTLDGAGTYNATSYGVQFWQLAKVVGMGGIQL